MPPGAPAAPPWEPACDSLQDAVERAFFRAPVTRAALRRHGVPAADGGIDTGPIDLAAASAHERLAARSALERIGAALPCEAAS